MSIGRLIVDFEARTGKFETDTDRARKTAEKRAKQIDKAFADAGRKIGLALAAGTAAATAALTALAKRSIDTADQLAKLSQQANFSVESLSRLGYAAGLSGVEDLDNALIKFNRSLSEAAKGTKAQAEAFESLGISILDVDGNLRPTEVLFNEVADAISKTGDSAAKTGLVIDLFGRSGAALIPLLNGGAEGLRKMGEESDRLGRTISTSTAKAAERFNDNLARMGELVNGVGNQIAASLADPLADLTDGFADAAVNSEDFEKFLKGIGPAAESAAIGITVVGESVFGVIKAVDVAVSAFRAAAADLELIGNSVGRVGLGFVFDGQKEEFERQLAERNAVVSDFNRKLTDLIEYDGAAISNALKRSFAKGEIASAYKGVLDTQKLLNTGFDDVPNYVEDNVAVPFRDAAAAQDAMAKAAAKAQKALKDAADDAAKAGEDVEKAAKRGKGANDLAALAAGRYADELNRIAEAAAQSLSGASTDLDLEIRKQERYNQLLREGVSIEDASRIIEKEFATVRSNELDAMRNKLDILRQQGDQLEEALDLEEQIAAAEKKAAEDAAAAAQDAFDRRQDQISQSITDAIINGGLDSVDDLADIIGNALKAEAFGVTIQPIIEDISAQINSIFTSVIDSLATQVKSLVDNVNIGGASLGKTLGLAGVAFAAFDFTRSLRPENSALSADAFGAVGLSPLAPLAGLDSLTGGSVFGGKWKTDDLRLLGELTNGTFEGFLQQYTSKKLSAGRGTRRRNFEVEAPEFIDEIAAMFEASFANATRAADALSVSVGEFAYSLDESIIGLEGADLTARIEEIIGGAADALASQTLPGIEAFQAEGENLGQTLNRVASAAMATQDGLDLISQSLDLTGLALVEASQDLAGLFGGIEGLGSALSSYYGAFFTAQEREQRLIESLTESFGDLGYVLPDTRDGFRDIVESLDLTEEAGRDAFASLLGLSDGLDEILSAAEARAEEAAQRAEEQAEREAVAAEELAALTQSLSIELMEAEGNALGALAARRQIELDALDESLRPMQERINALNDEAEAAALAVIEADKKAQLDREIAAEGASLQRQLLELQGDTAAIRAIERAALFEVNRELYDRINALRDEQAATQDAARAAEELTRAQEQAMAEAGRLAEQQLQQARDNLGKAFASEISGLQGIVSAVGEAESRLSQARSDLSSAYQREAGEIEATISRFEALADALSDFQAEVGRTIAVTQGGAVAAARARFEATARQARLGNENALVALPDAGRDFAAQLQSTAANRVELIRGLVGIQREAAAAENVANRQKTIAEQQLEALNRQVERFGILNESVLSVAEATSMVVQAEQASRWAEQQAEEAQAQIEEMERQRDQLLNIDNSVLSVQAAITALQIAEAANAALIAGAVSAGLASAASIAASAARSIPGLAGGGYANGLTWVGEYGPELINAANGRVYSNSQSMAMAASSGLSEDARLDRMEGLLRQTTLNTGKLVRIEDRWEKDGLPETRNVA